MLIAHKRMKNRLRMHESYHYVSPRAYMLSYCLLFKIQIHFFGNENFECETLAIEVLDKSYEEHMFCVKKNYFHCTVLCIEILRQTLILRRENWGTIKTKTWCDRQIKNIKICLFPDKI